MSLSYMYGFPSLRMSEAERLRQEERYRPHSRIFRLPNLGSHTYQQRHNKLIAYTVQAYHGEYRDYRRSIKNQHGFIDFLNVVNLREPSRSGKSQMALELDRKYGRGKSTMIMGGDFVDGSAFKAVSVPLDHVDYFSAWTGDRHFGLEPGRSSDAVLSQKHLPPPPIKKIQQSSLSGRHVSSIDFTRFPTFGLSWLAAGHQLSLKDLAGDVPFENKLIAAGLDVMGRLTPRVRNTGKSMSIACAMVEAHALTTWYAKNRSTFVPHGYQADTLEFLTQRKPVLLPLV